MKTKFFNKIILCAILILFLVLSSTVFATNVTNTNSDNVVQSLETNYDFVSSDLFRAGLEVNLSQIIDGNAFAYGSNVNVTGEIYGDLLVFSNNLIISEDAIIHGNIFAFSNNISFSGIASDIYAFASNFSMESESIIARNLYVSSNNVSLNGKISRDAFITANDISFAESENAIIEGNFNYSSENEIEIPDELVKGEIEYTAITKNPTNIALSILTSTISALLFSFVVIMLSIWLSPNFKDKACEIITKSNLKAFGIGLLVFFGIIIAAFILLLFTYGYGAGIAVAGIGLLILAYSIANTVFSISIGKLLANKFNFNKNTAFVLFSLLIVLIINLISYIPYVGKPITFITAIIGLGILSINSYKRVKTSPETEKQ